MSIFCDYSTLRLTSCSSQDGIFYVEADLPVILLIPFNNPTDLCNTSPALKPSCDRKKGIIVPRGKTKLHPREKCNHPIQNLNNPPRFFFFSSFPDWVVVVELTDEDKEFVGDIFGASKRSRGVGRDGAGAVRCGGGASLV